MDLEDIRMKSELPKPDKLLEIGIYREIQSSLVDRALLQSTRRIAQDLADIGRGKFNAPLLQRVWQQSQGRLLDRALSGVGIGRLLVVSLFVLLREDSAGRDGQNKQGG